MVNEIAALQALLSPVKQCHTLTVLVRSTLLTISSGTVPPAPDNFSATHSTTTQTEKIRSDSSARSRCITNLYCQKQNLMLTDLVPLKPLIISSSFVPTALGGSSATYVLITQTEQIRSHSLVR